MSYYAIDPAELPEPPTHERAVRFSFEHNGNVYEVEGVWSFYEYDWDIFKQEFRKAEGIDFSEATKMWLLDDNGNKVSEVPVDDNAALWIAAHKALETNSTIHTEWHK